MHWTLKAIKQGFREGMAVAYTIAFGAVMCFLVFCIYVLLFRVAMLLGGVH